MRHAEFTWQNADDLTIFAQRWLPEADPVVVICLVHGQGEHSSRYGHVATAFTNAGYALFAFDHQGHGKSEGVRGDMASYEALLDDIAHLLSEATQQYPSLPYFLYGHSMGGNLVLNYALRRKPQLTGIIATSPWLRLTEQPSVVLVSIIRLMSKVWPSLTIPNGLDVGHISRDQAEVAAYQNDPLNHDRVSARQAIQVDDAGQWALEHAADFSLPLLIMHGSGDQITSCEASQQFTQRVPGDCTFKQWAGLYHETHNDLEKVEVIETMVKWVRQHLPDNLNVKILY